MVCVQRTTIDTMRMSEKMKKRLLQVLITGLVTSSMIVTPVMATPQDEVNALKDQKAEAEAEAASVNSELKNLLVSFDVLKLDIQKQEEKIETATKDLEAAEEKEKQQYSDMKIRIQYMYEEGDSSFLETLISSKSFTELISKAEYVQNVHSYDRKQLEEYIETKKEVAALKENLEVDKADMDALAEEMQVQQTNLESRLTEMRSQIADFDTQLAAAEAEAAAYLAEIQRQEQERQETANNNANKPSNNTSNNSSNNSSNNASKPSQDKEETASTPSNASLGQQIANKGCQYIGNPYVYGGNSLTNGIDCSGFVQQIHAKFGISTPRTSESLRYGGKSVSYSNMLPGDVVCYEKHVGIYIGGGTIVHASNSSPYPAGGIKTSSVNYRTILAIRRYW